MIKLQHDIQKLFANFLSLSALQAVNMVLPFVTMPYLVRVLGVENFGLLNFSLSIVMYFLILVCFGFELFATREISIHRDNLEKVSEIFSAVMIIKIVMALISFAILSTFILTIEMFSGHATLYYVTFGIVLGNILFPTWFFQGMEKMEYIAYINVTARLMFTVFIFILVRSQDDYILVPLLNALGAILGGAYSLWLIFHRFHIIPKFPEMQFIKLQFCASLPFFISRVANDGSRYFATTIIGLYFGNTVVGLYSIVEKLFYGFMSLGGVVSQTIYPYMCRTKNLRLFKKIVATITVISIVILIPIMTFNEQLLILVFNIKQEMLSRIFLIVFSGSIFGIISALVGYPLLAAFGYIKYANNSLIYASLLFVIYITLATTITQNIYVVAFSIPVYIMANLIIRIYYLKKANILAQARTT